MYQDIHPDQRDRQQVVGMFDRIAPAYDRLNHILSLGQDFRWRRRAARCLDLPVNARVLDLAVGTGDLLIEILRAQSCIGEAVGIDLSEPMLDRCREKLSRGKTKARVTLERADAMDLHFADHSFDAVTMAFGIRNTSDRLVALKEIVRILAPGGQAVILEFATPPVRLVRWAYFIYIRTVVPLLGGLLSGRPDAYRYLNQTIEGFPRPEAFKTLMVRAGFENVDIVSLSWGTVCIYHGWTGKRTDDHYGTKP